MSISLNDHEQRIKNIDAQIPVINNKISSLEQNQAKAYAFDTSKLGSITSDVDNWQMIDVTDKISYTISSNTFVSGNISIKYRYATGSFHFSLRKQNVDLSCGLGTNSHGKAVTGYFKIANNRLSVGVGDQSRYTGTYSFTGLLYLIDTDNLYYKLSDRVSSLFSEVISCLSA